MKILLNKKRSLLRPFPLAGGRSVCSFQACCLACCGLFTATIFINALPKNSPPDCFFNGRLQVLLRLILFFDIKTKKRSLLRPFPLAGAEVSVIFKPAASPVAAYSQSQYSSTLSLKTVLRTVFLTVAFKSFCD